VVNHESETPVFDIYAVPSTTLAKDGRKATNIEQEKIIVERIPVDNIQFTDSGMFVRSGIPEEMEFGELRDNGKGWFVAVDRFAWIDRKNTATRSSPEIALNGPGSPMEVAVENAGSEDAAEPAVPMDVDDQSTAPAVEDLGSAPDLTSPVPAAVASPPVLNDEMEKPDADSVPEVSTTSAEQPSDESKKGHSEAVSEVADEIKASRPADPDVQELPPVVTETLPPTLATDTPQAIVKEEQVPVAPEATVEIAEAQDVPAPSVPAEEEPSKADDAIPPGAPGLPEVSKKEESRPTSQE
jgi:hypothetical protein